MESPGDVYGERPPAEGPLTEEFTLTKPTFQPRGPEPRSKRTKIMLAALAGVFCLIIGMFAGGAIGAAPIKGLESQLAYEKTRVASLAASEASIKETMESERDASATALAEAEADYVEKEEALTVQAEALETRESEAAALEKSLATEVEKREASKVSTGLHEVGVDIKPGKYKTSGPNGNNSAGCYYAWKTSFGADADIIDNELTQGNATVVLKKGQYFEVGACEDFIKQ